jgi:hypothetical protein
LEKKIDQQLKKYPHISERYKMDHMGPDVKLKKYSVICADIKKEVKERKKSVADSAMIKIIKKHEIVSSLKVHLVSDKNSRDKVEDFHQALDQQKKQLKQHRDSTLIKWLGVFAAGLSGLGIFSYWTVKGAYRTLFKTKAEEMVLDKVHEIRREKYLSN